MMEDRWLASRCFDGVAAGEVADALDEGLEELGEHPLVVCVRQLAGFWEAAQAEAEENDEPAFEPTRMHPYPAGGLWSLTSRTVEGKFLFAALGEHGKQVAEYTLAVMLERYEMDAYAYAWMSNHYHLAAGDRAGRKGDFLRTLNATMANVTLEALKRRFEDEKKAAEAAGEPYEAPVLPKQVFAREGPGRVEALTEEALLPHLAYIEANPVSAGVVAHPRAWSWAVSRPEDVGRPRVIKKPPFRYFADSKWPDEVTLTVKPTPGLREKPLDEARRVRAKHLKVKVAAVVKERKAEAAKTGRPAFAGLESLEHIDPLKPHPHPNPGESPMTPKAMGVSANGQRAYRYVVALYRRAHAAVQWWWKRGRRTLGLPGRAREPLAFPAGSVVVPRQLNAPVEAPPPRALCAAA